MAMKINLDNLNPGTFFPFEEDNPEEGGVTLRVLTAEKLEEIFKKTQIRKAEYKGSPPSRFVFSEYKKGGEEKEFELTWDYCILDWSGVVNAAGEEIPCNSQNKILLMKGSPKFSSFITNCVDKINEAAGIYEEELEKN